MMKCTLTALAITLGASLIPSNARAQAHEFGHHGEFIVSADRLVPLFAYTRVAQDTLPSATLPGTSGSTTSTQTSMSFLYGGVAHDSADASGLFFTVPRLGLDYVLAPNVTVGGDIILFFTLGGSQTTEVDTGGSSTRVTTDRNGLLVFGMAPRAGYVLPLSNLFSLWLRGGLSFYTGTVSTPSSAQVSHHYNTDQFGLDLEPQLVITPVRHVGITVGVTADLPLTGRYAQTDYNRAAGSGTVTVTEQSVSSSVMLIGVTAGLLAYF